MTREKHLFLFGFVFGFALSRVEASDYALIYGMFSGEDLKLAWVMITAILVGWVGMRYLKWLGLKTAKGEDIQIQKKPLKNYHLLGAVLFGAGWAMSGACPGTVLAQIGEGRFWGIWTFIGLLAGTYAYAILFEKVERLRRD